MKNQFKIYLVSISVVFLTSYNGQVQTNNSTNHLKQLDSKLGITKSLIEKIDTLFTSNAPTTINEWVKKYEPNKL